MSNVLSGRITFDRMLVVLFKLFAFSLPFELILEDLFNIDTILKPFRVFALLIIATYIPVFINAGWKVKRIPLADFWLYIIFIYGLVISMIRIITRPFHVGYFFNTTFQLLLLLGVYLIFKGIKITKETATSIFRYFMVGVLINISYISFQSSIGNMGGRLSGFSDNPNYVSLGLAVVIIYILHSINYENVYKRKFLYGFIALLLLFPFDTTGSRTGLITLVVGFIILFLLASVFVKVLVAMLIIFTSLFFLTAELDKSATSSYVLLNRFQRNVEGEEDIRVEVWRGTFRVIEEEGYFGLGIGQFQYVFPKYYQGIAEKKIMDVVQRGAHLNTHNDYLGIIVDYGIACLLFYLIFLGTSIKQRFSAMVSSKKEDRFFSEFQLIILVFLIIFGLTADSFQHHLYWFLLMFSTKEFE